MGLNCAPSDEDPTGTAGTTGSQGSAGTGSTQGAAGTGSDQGAAGTGSNQGTAGTGSTPAGTAGTGSTPAGTAGTGSTPAGTAGTGVVSTGTAGNSGGGTFVNYEYTGNWPKQPIAMQPAVGTLTYKKITVHNRFLAESCSIADYDKDGNPDVSSGRRWWSGPDFKTEHIYRGGHDDLPRDGASAGGPTKDEINTGVSDDWSDFPFDVDGDGNTDIINIANCDTPENTNPSPKPAPQPKASAYWYKNPGPGSTAMWTGNLIHNDVRLEQHGLVDVDGDGKPEIFGACKGCAPGETKGYYKANWGSPTTSWTYVPVTQRYTFPFGGTGWLHGQGFGDINGDGKSDLLERGGIWIQAAAPTNPPSITACAGGYTNCAWVKTSLYDNDPGEQRGPSHMYVADMDGDGDGDIVAADWAHGWGISWYEQTAPATFKKWPFMGSNSANDIKKYGPVYFSEPHSLQVADMDGDKIPDIVTGKMRFAHPISYGDPDPNGPPLLYVFKTVRTPKTLGDGSNGGPLTFTPFEVDKTPDPTLNLKAGVGRQLSVGHTNKDGIMDICIASKMGLYVFQGQ
jgi:hypothetical protein